VNQSPTAPIQMAQRKMLEERKWMNKSEWETIINTVTNMSQLNEKTEDKIKKETPTSPNRWE
jgi:hypothetical protein